MAHSQHIVFNKIIFDTLAEQYQIFPDKNIQNIMSNLLKDIPVYKWKPGKCGLIQVMIITYLKTLEIIHEAELDDVL